MSVEGPTDIRVEGADEQTLRPSAKGGKRTSAAGVIGPVAATVRTEQAIFVKGVRVVYRQEEDVRSINENQPQPLSDLCQCDIASRPRAHHDKLAVLTL